MNDQNTTNPANGAFPDINNPGVNSLNTLNDLHSQNATLTQETQRLVIQKVEAEAKIRELQEALNRLEAERDQERLQLGNVLLQANKTVEAMTKKAEQDAQEVIAAAKKEAGQLFSAARQESEAMRRNLNTEYSGLWDTFGKITGLTEDTRQNMLKLLQEVDNGIRAASGLIPPQLPQPVEVQTAPPHHNRAPTSDKDAFLGQMGDMLKNVPPPIRDEKQESEYLGSFGED